MTTQQRLGLQSRPTQTLAHQAQQRSIRLPQQITDLPGALLLRLLQHQLILKVCQGRQHTVSIPIRIDAPLPTCEYFSSKEIQDDMLRNRRYKNDPRDKQIRTLTNSQEYGWHDAQEQLKTSTRAARTQSDITKFAAELIKNGVYY